MEQQRPPLQFGLRSLLLAAVAVAVVFGTLKYLGVGPLASAVVLVIIIVGVAAAVGLLVAIAASVDDEDQ